MPFPLEVKAEALIACGRRCCICHTPSGVRMECHHIIPEAKGGPDTLENCIPLCFNCHADVEHYNTQHPKGNKFSPEELRGHRDNLHRMRREAVMAALEKGEMEPDEAHGQGQVLPPVAPAKTAEPELTTEEVKIMACVEEGKDTPEVVRLTSLSNTRAQFHLQELRGKKLIFFQAYTDGRGYWLYTHEGRRYVITKNLVP